jgi:hypothetical protein
VFKKIILFIFIALVLFCSGFFAAIKYNQGSVSELENRIARVTETNRQLQDENAAISRRAANLTVRINAIAKRAETARAIISCAESDADAAAELIDRIIRRVELLESAVSVMLEAFPN